MIVGDWREVVAVYISTNTAVFMELVKSDCDDMPDRLQLYCHTDCKIVFNQT